MEQIGSGGSAARVDLRRSPKALQRLAAKAQSGMRITELTVRGGDTQSLADLKHIPELEALDLQHGRLPADLIMPNLAEYVGPWSPALQHWPALEVVAIDTALDTDLALVFSGPVAVLGASRIEGRVVIDHLAHPELLSHVHFERVNAVDVTYLDRCPGLHRVLFESVGVLEGAASLRSVRDIYWIGLSDVSDVRPIDALVGVHASGGAGVVSRHPFPHEVRRRMQSAEPKWSFPPDERYFVTPNATTEQPHWQASPFASSAGDLVLELTAAIDVRELLSTTFAEVIADPEDDHLAERAIAAASWLLSGTPYGPDVLDGPEREIPALDLELRNAASAALSAILAAENQIHDVDVDRLLQTFTFPP